MRNLKRALSLTLASVMLLGMMVVGSSAAAGYDDVSKTDNVEAIEVLQTIEVMVGDERGFGPERPVNRAEMAVVMGKLLNLDYNYYATSCPFNDVYDWARGYVGACYANKIVSGRGEGVYDPGATVTAVEAASMLMRALGYFQYANDVSDGFELSTVRQGTKIGIFDQVGSSATDPMTRNQVAQMVLNALKSGVVEPDGNTINLTTPDGTVFTGKVNYVYVTSQKDFAYAISNVGATSIGSQNSGAIVELGERLYNGDLKLSNYYADDFGRPARHWEYDGKDIGTYVKKELLKKEWTTKVTGRDLYDVLTKPTIDKYDFYISIDGETQQGILDGNSNPSDAFFFNEKNLIRSNTEKVGGTGNGVLTQVFVDPNEGSRGTVYIAIINTYFAKAANNYDAKKDQVKLEVFAVEEVTATIDSETVKGLVKNAKNSLEKSEKRDVSGEDFDIENVKKGDKFLVNVADNEIKVISDVESVDGISINMFKNGSYVNADGTQYDYSSAALYDWDVLDQYVKDNMKDTTYNLFLDEYGYMIGIEIVEKPTNYLFLAGIDLATSNLKNKTAYGNAIFLDGTMAEIKIDMDKSQNVYGTPNYWEKDMTDESCALMNTWCTYTVSDDNVYTLKEVANDANSFASVENRDKTGQSRVTVPDTSVAAAYIGTTGGVIDKKHPATPGIAGSTRKTVYGNDNTIYLIAEVDEITATNPQTTDSDKDEAIVISGVDSVITGVQNANLKVWNPLKTKATLTTASFTPQSTHEDIAYGVYNLFDEDGYVIAAVVVGEDDGATSSYAYVISDDMNSEAYAKDGKKYTWGRDVVVNGEVVTLKEITDGSHPEIETMVQGQWYEMKYKADGTVKSKKLIAWDNGDATADDYEFFTKNDSAVTDSDTNKFIGRLDIWEKSMEAVNGTVVLSQNLTDATLTTPTWYAIDPGKRYDDNVTANGIKSLSASGNTLWIDTGVAREGLTVTKDAKIVMVQDKQVKANGIDKKPVAMEYVYTYDNDGGQGLKDMIDDLNKKGNNFVGFVSAVFDNGPATSVIVWDQTPEDIDAGDNTQTNTPVGTLESNATINEMGLSIAVNYTDADYLTPITKALEKAGYTLTSWDTVTHPVTTGMKLTASKDGANKTFTINAVTHFSTIKINGANVPKQDGTTVAAALGVPATAKTFVKDSANNYIEVTDAIVAGTNYIPTLYAEVTITGSGATKVLATSTVGAATSKTPSATVFMKQTVGVADTYVATNSTVVPGATYDNKEYVAVTVTSAVDSTGATTGFGNGATTATAALKSTETGYFEKGTTGDVNITVTIAGTATAGAVDVTAAVSTDGGTATVGTVKSGSPIATSTAAGDVTVVVTLTTAQTAGAVNIALTVAD